MAFIAEDFGLDFQRVEVEALGFNEAAVKLGELAGYFEDVGPVMATSAAIARHDMEKRFVTQTSPEGYGNKAWRSLDPLYEKRKIKDVGFAEPILTRGTNSSNKRHRKLRDASTEAWRFHVAGDSLFYDTSNLPTYWHAHQVGRDFLSANVPTVRAQRKVKGFEKETSETYTGLPPRPYIGLSSEATYEILVKFDQWVSFGLEEATKHFAISGSGTLQTRIAGRFGPKPIIG
jgi:hypothetical protein